MNNDQHNAEAGYKALKIICLYFSLYIGTILMASICLWDVSNFLPFLFFFPAALGSLLGGGIELTGLVLGVGIFLSILILMLIFRRKKAIVWGMFAIFILLMFLSIRVFGVKIG